MERTLIKKGKAITAKEIAQISGFSQAVVSRAFNPNTPIKKTTREKIQQIAKDNGYRPNAIARSLITNQSNIIGIVVGYLENQFYPLVVQEISKKLQKKNYHLLIFFAQNNEDTDNMVNSMLDYRVDGVIVASVSLSSKMIAQCYNAHIPIVLFNRIIHNSQCSWVETNNTDGARKIAQHLIGLGHTKIAFMAGDENASTSLQREKALIQTLSQHNLKLFKREVGNFDINTTIKATKKLVKGDMPDAIFAANDYMAIAVIDTLRYELNIRVPEDISVVGFDDVPQSSWGSYQLTTFKQPMNKMIDATLSFLLDNINNRKNTVHKLSLEGELVIRNTTKKINN